MRKEKTVRTYQRRTKSGKMVTVREHKASYDAAEEALKAAAKKAGAGSELSKKKAIKEESPLGFSADDYKEWYHWDPENDANNEAALRVEKALIKKMGKKAYNKYFEDMTNSYSARGHKKAHQALLDEHTASQKKQDAEIKVAAKDIARGAKEKAAEAKASKVNDHLTADSKAKSSKVKTPKNESQEQRDARWNRGEFTDDEKSMAITVYDLSGSKNSLHPKLSAWAKKEIKRMDDERAAKVDTKILKGLDRGVISKLATLQGKKKLSKEDEAFVDKYVAPSGLIRGTKISAFDALAAHKKEIKGTEKKSGKSSSAKNKPSDVSVDDVKKAYLTQGGLDKLGLKRKSSEGAYETYQHKSGKLFRVYTPSGAVQDITPTGKVKKRGPSLKNEKAESKTKKLTTKETSAELRKQADEMDAKAYKETSRATHKKLIEKGYKKHTWQGHTYYYKGKEGSYSGSYVTLDEKGKQTAVMPSLKERFKEQIARSIGKKYKGRRLK